MASREALSIAGAPCRAFAAHRLPRLVSAARVRAAENPSGEISIPQVDSLCAGRPLPHGADARWRFVPVHPIFRSLPPGRRAGACALPF